ncbi:hypothetical protein I350_07616 [Cryptococcus amylolentus CBS 6273]|uniref:HTH CENPB-type domain-containing protein n=1 Tax=Cryptococcus amylolentus CBS 6273 TaxID=1296118 RepID=A0A1E3JAV6_9TREE|nr:hypothetical protein I350_07616 [Cryptococcus amylolentus CBS 6273]
MADAIDSAVQYKRAHPEESFPKVANQFKVTSSTLNNRYHKKHASHATNNPRKLSVIQEKQLVDTINTYAERGTPLTSAKIRELGQALHGHPLGERWGSTFVERHRADLNSKFYGYTGAGRQDDNTSENNTAIRNGELDPVIAVAQAQTDAEVAKSKIVLLEKELEEVRAAMALDQATRGSREAVQNLGGGLYDLKYRDDNREALEKRKAKEEKNNRGGSGKASS